MSLQVAEYIETKMGCCYETFVQIASYIEYVSILAIQYDISVHFVDIHLSTFIQAHCSQSVMDSQLNQLVLVSMYIIWCTVVVMVGLAVLSEDFIFMVTRL